jgi:hypothetical protein
MRAFETSSSSVSSCLYVSMYLSLCLSYCLLICVYNGATVLCNTDSSHLTHSFSTIVRSYNMINFKSFDTFSDFSHELLELRSDEESEELFAATSIILGLYKEDPTCEILLESPAFRASQRSVRLVFDSTQFLYNMFIYASHHVSGMQVVMSSSLPLSLGLSSPTPTCWPTTRTRAQWSCSTASTRPCPSLMDELTTWIIAL